MVNSQEYLISFKQKLRAHWAVPPCRKMPKADRGKSCSSRDHTAERLHSTLWAHTSALTKLLGRTGAVHA